MVACLAIWWCLLSLQDRESSVVAPLVVTGTCAPFFFLYFCTNSIKGWRRGRRWGGGGGGEDGPGKRKADDNTTWRPGRVSQLLNKRARQELNSISPWTHWLSIRKEAERKKEWVRESESATWPSSILGYYCFNQLPSKTPQLHLCLHLCYCAVECPSQQTFLSIRHKREWKREREASSKSCRSCPSVTGRHLRHTIHRKAESHRESPAVSCSGSRVEMCAIETKGLGANTTRNTLHLSTTRN